MVWTRQTIVSDIITVVRETLQDMEGDRYTDTRIIRAINLGIAEVRRKRPDYFIGTFHEPTFIASDVNEIVPLPQDVILSLVDYAIGWVEMADDEYTTDGRAAAFMAKFEADLK